MFCPNCGTKLIEGHKFCGKCGYNVESKSVTNEAVKQMATTVSSGVTKVKTGAKKIMESKQTQKVKGWFGKRDNKIYLFAMIFMFISILIALRAPDIVIQAERQKQYMAGNGVFQRVVNSLGTFFMGSPGTEIYYKTVHNPFKLNGLASVLAVILYSVILYRNKNTLTQFDKEKIDKKVMILHLLNLIFLLTVCSLFTTESNIYLPFMSNPINPIYIIVMATLLSAVSMRSLSGIFWIIAVVAILSNLKQFNEWYNYSAAYIICAYISLIIQVLMLKLFNIDIEDLKQDFTSPMKRIGGDVKATIDSGKKVTDMAVNATKVAVNATTGIPVASLQVKNNENEQLELVSE